MSSKNFVGHVPPPQAQQLKFGGTCIGEVSPKNLRGLIAEASTELQLESIVNLKIWGA